MNELSILQVDADMGYFSFRAVAGKKEQVSFFQVSFGYLVAPAFQGLRVAWHLNAVYFTIYLINHAGTVSTSL
jgi:hypothetical protein